MDSPTRSAAVSDSRLLYASVCGVIPYCAAIDSSVSPGATTCASSAGGSLRTAVIGAARARRAGRGRSSVGTSGAAWARSGRTIPASRPRSSPLAATADGPRPATTMQRPIPAALPHSRRCPRLLGRRRGARRVIPKAISVDRVNAIRSSTRLVLRRFPPWRCMRVLRASSVPVVPAARRRLCPR